MTTGLVTEDLAQPTERSFCNDAHAKYNVTLKDALDWFHWTSYMATNSNSSTAIGQQEVDPSFLDEII